MRWSMPVKSLHPPTTKERCSIFPMNEISFFSSIETTFALAETSNGEKMPKVATKKRLSRRGWTPSDIKELKQHSKNKTPVKAVSTAMKRSESALRQKAFTLGVRLGHRRSKKR